MTPAEAADVADQASGTAKSQSGRLSRGDRLARTVGDADAEVPWPPLLRGHPGLQGLRRELPLRRCHLGLTQVHVGLLVRGLGAQVQDREVAREIGSLISGNWQAPLDRAIAVLADLRSRTLHWPSRGPGHLRAPDDGDEFLAERDGLGIVLDVPGAGTTRLRSGTWRQGDFVHRSDPFPVSWSTRCRCPLAGGVISLGLRPEGCELPAASSGNSPMPIRPTVVLPRSGRSTVVMRPVVITVRLVPGERSS